MIFFCPKKFASITPGSTNNVVKVDEKHPKSNALCPCPKGPLTPMGIRWTKESKIVTVQAVARSTLVLPLVVGCKVATFPLQNSAEGFVSDHSAASCSDSSFLKRFAFNIIFRTVVG